jgi:hypothetical protein
MAVLVDAGEDINRLATIFRKLLSGSWETIE